jgi:hypothetical protein
MFDVVDVQIALRHRHFRTTVVFERVKTKQRRKHIDVRPEHARFVHVIPHEQIRLRADVFVKRKLTRPPNIDRHSSMMMFFSAKFPYSETRTQNNIKSLLLHHFRASLLRKSIQLDSPGQLRQQKCCETPTTTPCDV